MDPESREARKRLIRSDRATRKRPIQKPGFPWPPNVPRGPQESHFKQFEVLGRQTPPGGPQEARFNHFGPLAAKRPKKPQEAPGKPQEPREPHEPREAPEAQGAQGSPRSPREPQEAPGIPRREPREAPGGPRSPNLHKASKKHAFYDASGEHLRHARTK